MNMANFIEKNTSAEACCHFAPPTQRCAVNLAAEKRVGDGGYFCEAVRRAVNLAAKRLGVRATNRIQREF
jgi:hypothetical protein